MDVWVRKRRGEDTDQTSPSEAFYCVHYVKDETWKTRTSFHPALHRHSAFDSSVVSRQRRLDINRKDERRTCVLLLRCSRAADKVQMHANVAYLQPCNKAHGFFSMLTKSLLYSTP